MKYKFKKKYIVVFLLVFITLTIYISCSQKGLISEKFSGEDYKVPKLIPNRSLQENPTFITYGDVRPGYRIMEKFLKKENWYTWKMLIFPFYEFYLLGNGIIGRIDLTRNDSGFGYKERIMVRDAVYNEAKDSEVDFILNTGDFVIDGRYPNHWMRFINENKIEVALLNEIPYLPTIGSHEWANDSTFGLKNYNAIFEYPRFYVIEYPDIDIFVIDSNIILDQEKLIDDDTQDKLFNKWIVSKGESEQPAWLEEKLANSDKTFKVISMHHPPISFGTHHSDWMRTDCGNNLIEKRKLLLKMFQKYGVQIIFCSHEHLYERNILRYETNDNNGYDEIQIIISGGGGVPLREKSSPDKIQEYLDYYNNEGLDVIQVKQKEMYHYCLVDVDANQVRVDVIEVRKDTEKPTRLEETFVIKKD